MKFDVAIAIIPARFNSTRFPGKPLVEIDGKPLIEHVYRRVEQASLVHRIIVATDDLRIAEAVRRFGATAIMTRNDHQGGPDRLAEAAASQGLDPDTLVVNVQGDEPMVEPEVIDKAISAACLGDAEIVTLMTRLDPAPLEMAERLEQLRALEHGYRIRVVEVESESWGIDTPADLERFRLIRSPQ